MAYRFDGVDDQIRFAITPFSSYGFGPLTIAVYFKLASTGSNKPLVAFVDNALSTNRNVLRATSGNLAQLITGANFSAGPSLSSTSVWYLLVATTAAGASPTPRFHLHNGTSWAHSNGAAAVASGTIGSTDRLYVGAFPGINFSAIDVVCAGVKKADSADATAETLSTTAFQTWRDFGFDWLIGFDSSLESAGVLQDQGTPGTGDETSRTGTTAVADPAGWSWSAPAAPTFVPQIVIT